MANNSLDDHRGRIPFWGRRIRARRTLLGIILLMFVLLVATGFLTWVPAFICWGILSGYVIGERGFERRARKRGLKRLDAKGSRVKRERLKVAKEIVGALDSPAMLLSQERVVLFYNAPAKQLFPTLSKKLPISRSLRAPELLSALERVEEEGANQHTQFEDAARGRFYHVAVSPIDLGKSAILLVFQDLTKGDKVEQMREDFVANASHELRTPLSSLKGYIETLQGSAANDKKAQEKFLGVMAQQADRMQNLIDDMLSLSRLEINQHIRPETRVDLDHVLQQQIAVMEPLTKAREITILYEPMKEPVFIFAEPDELAQLFSNLITNAIKYGKDKGMIRLDVTLGKEETSSKSQIVEIDVIDDGLGIDEKHIPRLTERFYRVDADASRARGGTGLGLAIVKHITKRLKGTLQIQSQKNKGSKFTVCLPVAEKEGPST